MLTNVATREAEAVGKRLGIEVSPDLTVKDVGNQLNEKPERLIAPVSSNGLKQTARDVLTDIASREVEALSDRFGMDVNAESAVEEVGNSWMEQVRNFAVSRPKHCTSCVTLGARSAQKILTRKLTSITSEPAAQNTFRFQIERKLVRKFAQLRLAFFISGY